MLFYFTKLIQVIIALQNFMPGNMWNNKKKDNIENNSPYQITQIGKDGGWLWFNNESVVIDRNTLYIGSEDSKGNSKVSLYPIDYYQYKKSASDYKLSSWPEKDEKYPYHNYPSLLKLNNGNLLAVYHHSSKDMFYRIAEVFNRGAANEYLKWGKENVRELNNGMNYNNLIQLVSEKNKIYNFFSIYKQSPSLMTSQDGGKSWSRDTVFMTPGKNGTSPYSRFVDNGIDRIDMIYTNGHPRNEPDNNIYHIYYYKGNFHNSDGKIICSLNQSKQTPITPELGTKVYNGANQQPGWVWDIEYDDYDVPVVAFISSADGSEGNDLRYRYAKWHPEKKQWEERQIAYAGTHVYVPENHFAGGISIDPENVNVVFISSNVDPETGKQTVSHRYQIYRGVSENDKGSWKWEQLTFDTNKDNLRPIVPRGHHYNICVIWQAMNDNASSLGFDSDILGVFKKK